MMQSPDPERAEPAPITKGRRLRWVALMMLAPLGLVAVVAAMLAFALATPSGSQMALAWLVARMPERLAIDQVQGTAWTGLSVARVRWTDPSMTLEANDLQLVLNWSSLLRRAPVMDQVSARVLRIALPASNSPPVLAETLRLPVPFELRSVRVESIVWSQGQTDPIELGPVSLSASYRGGRYRIEALQARAFEVGLTQAMIELNDEAPFGLRANGRLEAEPARLKALDAAIRARLPDQPISVALDVTGSLRTLHLTAVAAYAGARLEVRGSLDPLAPLPLAPIEGRLEAFDPARFDNNAPTASIGGTWVLRPADSALDLDLLNVATGRINDRKLPVERLQGEIRWRDQELAIAGLDLRLADGAQVAGSLRIDTSRRFRVLSHDLPGILADLQVRSLDPAALNTGWPTARLQAHLQVDHERVQVALPDVLGDRTLAVGAVVRLAGAQAVVERLEAALPFARARLTGAVGLVSPHAFAVEGAIDGVDPKRLLERLGLEAPSQSAGALNGEVRVQGELAGPARRADARLALRDSRIAGQRLAAVMTAGYRHEPQRLSVDARLDWGGNELTLRGAMGAADDRLRLSARLGRPSLFDRRLSGSLEADAVLSGELARPRLGMRLVSPRLQFGSTVAISAGEATVELDDPRAWVDTLRAAFAPADASRPIEAVAVESSRPAPDGGGVRLSLSAREIRAAAQTVQRLRAEAKGSLAAHAFQLTARLANQDVAIAGEGQVGAMPAAAGGAVDQQPAPSADRFNPARALWSGLLKSLRIEGLVSAELARPAQLEWLPGAVRLRDFALGSEGGALTLDDAWVSASELRTRGSASAVSLRPLIDWLEGGAPARASPPGVAAPAGVGGDARSDAAERLRALRLDARWSLAGPAWDRLDGELAASLKAGAPLPRSADAAGSGRGAVVADPVIGDNRIDVKLVAGRLAGEANLAIPSLRFSRRYTAPDWTIDGELLFSGQIQGTLRSPELVGALRAERLSLFNRSLGWRLRDGRIAARFDGRELIIDSIRFASGEGSMTVAGALRLVDRPAGRSRALASDLPVEGRLQLEARRLPVPLGPGQRLLLSGLTDLIASGGELSWRGTLRADEGLIELRSGGVPDLPADIRIVGESPPIKVAEPASDGERGWTPRISADLTVALGEALRVRGGGVDARLGGELTLSGVLPGAPRVRGLVDVRDGTFSAYGRRLEITRGLIRFAGELDNPVLDIVAMRRDQQVEAGVAVTGSALAPRIRLVSDPDLPEAQKLSWLVLGMGLDDVSNAGQARALSEAALAILGRSDEGLIANLTQRLGIDAVSVGATGANPRDRLGTARLAPLMPGAATSSGSASSAAAGAARQDVVTVSKRLSSRLTLSYERGLSGLWNLVRLQYDISRRLSLRAQSGSENALDLLYFWWFD